MEKLYIKTISRNLLDDKIGVFKSISFFNFESGTQKINLRKLGNNKILTQGTTWIRVYMEENNSYDFITSSITLFSIDGTLIVMCNDDAEFIDISYISKLIKEYGITSKEDMNFGKEEILESFYKNMKIKTKKISNKMMKLYRVSSQMASSRLNIHDSYDYGKKELEKMNMLDIIIKQVALENKKEILSLI